MSAVGGRAGQVAEPGGQGLGDGAGGGLVAGAGVVEGVGEPAPAHLGQQRIGGHLGVELGGHVRDQPQRALPGLVAGRVVQQDEPAVGDLVVVAQHGGADRVRVRRQTRGAVTSSSSISGRGRAGRAGRARPGRRSRVRRSRAPRRAAYGADAVAAAAARRPSPAPIAAGVCVDCPARSSRAAAPPASHDDPPMTR